MNSGLVFDHIRDNHTYQTCQHELDFYLRRSNTIENVLDSSSIAISGHILDRNEEQTDLSLSSVAGTDKNLCMLIYLHLL